MKQCQNCGIGLGKRRYHTTCVSCIVSQKSRAQWQKRKGEDNA